MLALAITSTVFLGISCITSFIKNADFFDRELRCGKLGGFLFALTYGWLWRALAIVTIWVLFTHLG